MYLMKANYFAAKCKDITALNTIYVMGGFGQPMTAENKKSALKRYEYNRRVDRKKVIEEADETTFGFDCVCFIKSVLWGFCADTNHKYGGATYQSNGVDDMTLDKMLSLCTDVSDDFSGIEIGELLYLPGHVGIYIGDGKAVEATPNWLDGVQITAVRNLDPDAASPARTWEKHGKLPWIDYTKDETPEATEKPEETPPDAPSPDESAPSAAPEQTRSDLYAVLLGIYIGKESAEKALDQAKKAGFDRAILLETTADPAAVIEESAPEPENLTTPVPKGEYA